ncbi:MAG: CHASE2 domain-containing protein [Opitutaceae bacterium]
MKRFQHSIGCGILVIGSLLFWLVFSATGLLDGVEQEALRWRYLARGEMQSSAPIVYVDLDAETVAAIGARPWDRSNFAILMNALLGVGEAKAVGVDIIFSQLGRGSLLDLERAKAGDIMLGQAVERYQEQVVLAAAYTGTTGPNMVPLIRLGLDDPAENFFPEAPNYPIINWEIGRLGLANVDEGLVRGVIPQWVVGFVEVHGEDYSRTLMQGMRRQLFEVMNEPKIVEVGEDLQLTDKDGWAPHQIPRYSEKMLNTLGLEVFLAANALSADDVQYDADYITIRKDGDIFREIPLVQQQSIGINWFEGWKTSASTMHVSIREVLVHANSLGQAARAGNDAAVEEARQWFDQFRDKVIFVGPVDPQLKDIAPTPFNRSPVPKVGVHANLYRTLHDEAYIAHASNIQAMLLVVGLTLIVTFLSLWNGLGAKFSRYSSLLLVATYGGVVFVSFTTLNLVLPLIAPVGASLTAALGILVIKLGAEEFERRRIKNLFGAYVSPELVDEMVNAQRDPELGGVETEISSLFSDVEGFSNLSEQLNPDELVALMNEYLGEMTEAIQVEGGTLDKYIGDAIVTMFGMPLPIPDHASRACLAAQRMQECHAKLRGQWEADGRQPEAIYSMRTRIGINTGNAVIGNMGSRVRFNYTMMGDSVNLAARCESGAKHYGIYTMVTGAVIKAAHEVTPDLPIRRLDRIVVKGKSSAVDVYELWDQSIDLEEARACAVLYEAGLEEYFKENWSAAIEQFERSFVLEPGRAYAHTTPSTVLIERCQQFEKHGKPEGWDGAYRWGTK